MGGWGKGGGKGMSHKSFTDDQKVWLGNIPDGVTYKELQPHMKQAGDAKWVECFERNGKGTGVACYSSAAEAQAAISTLNGSILNGQAIQVDSWVRKPSGAGKGAA